MTTASKLPCESELRRLVNMVSTWSRLIRISRGLFSYQIYMVLKPNPSLDYLLRQAEEKSAIRAAS